MRKTTEERFWSKVNKTEDCWLWTAGKNNGGYGQFYNGKKMVTAHRFSYQLNNETIPDGLDCLHKCDNPICVNPTHLFLGTQQDNSNDMISKQRQHHPYGENCHQSKLSQEDVLFIKQFPKYRGSGIELANRFNVTKTTIGYIRNGRNWKSVK